MRKKITSVSFFVVIILGILLSGRDAWAANEVTAVNGLEVSHRSGYTFITFKEVSHKDARYRVYRSDKPLSVATLTEANCIAILYQNSASIKDIRGRPELGEKAGTAERRAFVQDVDKGSQEIPKGTGLLVWTCQADEKIYYGVTSLIGAVEDKNLVAEKNVIVKPVDEKKAIAPLAIKAHDYGPGKPGGGVFLFPMDYRLWNPDKIDDNPEGYIRTVNVTIPADETKRKDPLPVIYLMHGMMDWHCTFAWALHYDKNMPVIQVGILCTTGDWYFGYANTITYETRIPKTLPPSNAIVYPYTEWLLLKTREWLLSNPTNLPAKADVNRFYSVGTSQGGTVGNLTIARHGDKFAVAMCSKGITRWDDLTTWSAAYGGGGGWINQFQVLYGKIEDNLKLFSGERIYDVLYVAKMLREHPEYNAPFMVLGQGLADGVIPWRPFPEYIRALEAGKHPFAAAWRPISHSGALYSATPMAAGIQEGMVRTPSDRAQLAFANCPQNDDLGQGRRSIGWALPGDMTQSSVKSQSMTGGGIPQFPQEFIGVNAYLVSYGNEFKCMLLGKITKVAGDTFFVEQNPLEIAKQIQLVEGRAMWMIADVKLSGEYNSFFEWHVNGIHAIPGARPTIDEAAQFEIQIRLAGAAAVFEATTADVTPRRCQKFKPAPGSQVGYRVLDCRGGNASSVLKEGSVEVDKHGLTTVVGVPIYKTGAGVRLVLSKK
ncbi:MAG: hypothetical protein V1899_07675 [Planctomycetota bacterium]